MHCSKTATNPKQRQPKRRQIQNGNNPKRLQTKTAIRQNGDTSKTATIKNRDIPKRCMSPFWRVAVLDISQRGVLDKFCKKSNWIVAVLTCHRFGFVAVLACRRFGYNQNGDTPKRRQIQNGDTVNIKLDFIYKLDFIRRTIPLIGPI